MPAELTEEALRSRVTHALEGLPGPDAARLARIEHELGSSRRPRGRGPRLGLWLALALAGAAAAAGAAYWASAGRAGHAGTDAAPAAAPARRSVPTDRGRDTASPARGTGGGQATVIYQR